MGGHPSCAKYNGRVLKWDTVIEQKAVELGRYLGMAQDPQRAYRTGLSRFRSEETWWKRNKGC